MIKQTCIAVVIGLALSSTAYANDTSSKNTDRSAGAKAEAQAAAIQRCDKLGGTEKELCQQQARATGERDRNATGATSGSGMGQISKGTSDMKAPHEPAPSDAAARDNTARP